MKMNGFNYQIKSLKPLERVSLSRYYDMVCCSLREVLLSNGVGKLLPSSPNTYFGTAAHKFREKAGVEYISQADFEKEWQRIITEIEQTLKVINIEKHLVPLNKVVPQYEIRKRLLFKKAISHYYGRRRLDSQLSLGLRTRLENWYETRDGTIGGIVDKIRETNNGYEIIDFKTGVILDNETLKIKKEYKYQMLLYAALIRENLNEWPISLKIQGLNEKEYLISYEQDECLKLVEEAKRLLLKVNKLVDKTENFSDLQKHLANPSPDHCRYCSFRPICNSYWEEREKSSNLKWNNDIRGEFESLTTLRNGTYLLKIRSEYKIYKIRGLKQGRHIDLNQSFLSIYNLHKEKEENCYHEGILTTIYSY